MASKMKKSFRHGLAFSAARKHLLASGREFVQYFSHGSLTVELFAPKLTDKQTPHDRDEVYVVVSGSGTFSLEGESVPFKRGDVLFAPAHKKHRFIRFTRDFSTWVFFYGPVNGENGTADNTLVSDNRSSTMAKLKTKKTGQNVNRFLSSIRDPGRKKDCQTLLSLMSKVTGEKPALWGKSMIGFGSYHYRYASGHEGDCFLTGFSARKQNLTVYVMTGFDRYGGLMKKLGKFKTGVSCLYIDSLDDIHVPTLRNLVSKSVSTILKRS
jgi:hypothetical protein